MSNEDSSTGDLDRLCDCPFESKEIEEAWAAEIERRIAEIESGRAELIPAEEVFARARRLIG